MYVDLFDKSETVRIARLRHDLQTDRVLTAGQVWERYRLSPGVLRAAGFILFWDQWAATPYKVKRHTVTCITLERELTELSGVKLRRETGLAEIRYLLQEPSSCWHSPKPPELRLQASPHIICCKRPGNAEIYAVVYVLGKSSTQDLLHQALALEQHFPTVVWGVATQARRQKLERCFAQLESTADQLVLCAPYAPELVNPYRYAYPCDDPETWSAIEKNLEPRWPWLQAKEGACEQANLDAINTALKHLT